MSVFNLQFKRILDVICYRILVTVPVIGHISDTASIVVTVPVTVLVPVFITMPVTVLLFPF